MTDTPNRPPLWREIDKAWWSLVDTADPHPLPLESDQAACVIRALRDWLVPEEPEAPAGDGEPWPQSYQQRSDAMWEQRQQLRAILTAEADRAEGGE